MKKGMMTMIAVALLMPVTLMAQGELPDKPFCPLGEGPGPRLMGQGHPGWHGGGCGPMTDRRGMGRQRGGIGHILMIGDKIDLTDEQRDRLKTMQMEFRMDRIDRKAELEKAQLELRMLKRDPDAAEADVLSAIDEVSRLRAEMQKTQYQHRRQVMSVLTDEQVEKLKELRQTRNEGKRDRPRMGRRGGWGRP